MKSKVSIPTKDQQNFIKLYFFASLSWLISCLNVLRSSWNGDDWPNGQTPYWVLWRYGEITPGSVLHEALYWNDQWMKGQGRFYLFQWIESRFMFSYLRQLWQYKIFETTLLLVCGLLFVILVFQLSKSHSLTISTLILLSITMQFRYSFDPHVGFGALVPSMLIKVLLTANLIYLAVKKENLYWKIVLSFGASIIYFVGMSTYEYAFLLFPLIILTYIQGVLHRFEDNKENSLSRTFSRSIHCFIPTFLSWFGYLILVFGYLRPRATSVSENYTLGISWKSIPVFLTQMASSLPMVAVDGNQVRSELNNKVSFWLGLILSVTIAIAAKSLFLPRSSETPRLFDTRNSSISNRIILVSSGVTLLSCPPFMMSLQVYWWSRASVKVSYLGILIQECGTALLIAIILNIWFGGRNQRSVIGKRA